MFARETGEADELPAFDVRPERIPRAIRAAVLRPRAASGLNITLPHKIAAVEVAHQLTTRAAHAASVNTLALQGEEILGDNTDGAGLVRDLCDNLGLVITHRPHARDRRRRRHARRARAAPRPGADLVVIANRSPERAEALATAFADLGTTQGVGFDEIEPAPFDLIINATSASLSGEIPPVPAGVVGPQTVCYDLAYGRSATAFVRLGAEQGCARAIQGWGMLVEQAAESFRLWRGVRPATTGVMERCASAPAAPMPECASAHRDQLLRARRMDRHGVVEVLLGGAHAHRHGKSLQHLVGPRADDVQAHDALLGADRHELHLGARAGLG